MKAMAHRMTNFRNIQSRYELENSMPSLTDKEISTWRSNFRP